MTPGAFDSHTARLMNPVHRVLDPTAGAQVPLGLCALGIMTKAPRPGRVKTRLSPPLTPEEAAALNICFLRDTAAAIAETAAEGIAIGVGIYTPVGEENAYADILPRDFVLVLQRGDLFGERLTLAIEDLLSVGFSSGCLIDSDSPTVPKQAYSRAAKLLAQPGERIVLGPSDDGGYYLIGMKQVHRHIFEEIDWSTDRVAEQTIERAKEIGVSIELLPTWYDVDDRATLQRLRDEMRTPNGGYSAPETRQFLSQLTS